MIPRLYAPARLSAGATLALDSDAAHHAVRVLRLAPGDPVELFDGDGRSAAATLTATRPAAVRIDAILDAEPDPVIALTLAQCLSSADKMDWTIEKAVELGVVAVVPLQSARSVVRLDAERAARRETHWLRLMAAACAQCRRNRLPRLHPVTTIDAWLRGLPPCPPGERRLILDQAAAESLSARSRGGARPEAFVLLCGPESGFGDGERALAAECGWEPVSLGPRVLRTETAGLAALAVLQAMLGDLR